MKAFNQGHWLACVMEFGILKNWYWVVEMLFVLMEHICLFQSGILSKCFDKQLHCFWTRDFFQVVVLTPQESLPHSSTRLTQWWPLKPVANTQYERLYGSTWEENGSLQHCSSWTEAVLLGVSVLLERSACCLAPDPWVSQSISATVLCRKKQPGIFHKAITSFCPLLKYIPWLSD